MGPSLIREVRWAVGFIVQWESTARGVGERGSGITDLDREARVRAREGWVALEWRGCGCWLSFGGFGALEEVGSGFDEVFLGDEPDWDVFLMPYNRSVGRQDAVLVRGRGEE